MKNFAARFVFRLSPALIAGCVMSACLSTESGNPESALASADGTSYAPSSAMPPAASPAGTMSPDASPVAPTASATATASATEAPSASVTMSAPGTSSASATEDTAEAPCEFSAEADAGVNDAGALLYRCAAVDGGVSCLCGTDPASAEPELPDGQVIPAGEACNSALLEQCGRAFP